MLDISKSAQAFLKDLQPKQYKQLAARIFALTTDQSPQDVRHLSGYPGYMRIDSGEYRIVFVIRNGLVYVPLVGKRNDDEVYRGLQRKINA